MFFCREITHNFFLILGFWTQKGLLDEVYMVLRLVQTITRGLWPLFSFYFVKLKGLTHDLGSKFQISSLFVYRINWSWKWCLVMFESFRRVMMTIDGCFKLGWRPSWIFSKGVSLWFWVKLLNFFFACVSLNWSWKWCLVIFVDDARVIMAIYECLQSSLAAITHGFGPKFKI